MRLDAKDLMFVRAYLAISNVQIVRNVDEFETEKRNL